MKNALGAVQSALVLGGGSDIASATMLRLVEGGCRTVLLAARHPDGLGASTAALTAAGATVVRTIPFDALDPVGHVATIEQCFEIHPDIDLVLVAFGVLGDQSTFDHDPVGAAAAVTTNYTGAVSALLAVAAAMRRQGHGTIVVLSSVAGERARRSNFVYGSSKAGLDAFAQGLGDALVGSGVHVLIVRPGFVHSKMTAGMDAAPLAATPAAVAEAIVNGIASGADVVWVPPALRWITMIMRHLPRALWRRVSASR